MFFVGFYAEQANQRLAVGEEVEDSLVEGAGDGAGGVSTGGGSGVREGKSALRCWRNNEAGEREEVDPWEHHHGGDVGEPQATSCNNNDGEHHSQSHAYRRGRRNRGGDGADAGGRASREGPRSCAVLDDEGRNSRYAPQESRRTATRVASDSKAGIDSALASSPYNEGRSGGGRKRCGGTPRRRASSPNLSSSGSSGRKGVGGVGSGRGRRGGDGDGEGGEGHTYTPSWAERNGRGMQHNGPAPAAWRAFHQGHAREGTDDSIRSPEATTGRRGGPPRSPREERLWDTREDSEDEAGLGSPWGGIERRRRGPTGCANRGGEGRDEGDNGRLGGAERRTGGDKGGLSCPAVPDPDLLSTLKRGGSRNAK